MHDIGIVAELAAMQKEFENAFELARTQGAPLCEAEKAILGLTHGEAGQIIGEGWHLPAHLIAVATYHHQPQNCNANRDLVALVSLSDLLCRMSGLGHGYDEVRQVNFAEEPGFAMLHDECPSLRDFDWARFTFEMEAYMEEVHRLVAALYRPPQ